MRSGRTLAVVALVSLMAAQLVAQRTAPAGSDADVLLQEGMHLEQVEGRLSEAIDVYKKVLAKAGVSKRTAATALLQLASSYEKLGRPETRATYQMVLSSYSDQPREAAAARAWLAAASPAASARRQSEGLTPRRVIVDETGFPTDVSLDGRLVLMLTNERLARLVIRDVLTKATTSLVVDSASSYVVGRSAIFSADARQVAYVWGERQVPVAPGGQPSRYSLRVIGAEPGATPRTIVAPQTGRVVPVGWSSDSRSILALVAGNDITTTPMSIAWVSVDDGAIRTVKTLEPWRNIFANFRLGSFGPRLSPDGSAIAYSALTREGSSDRYVYVIDANGQNERTVGAIAGSNTQPVWTPDSAHLLFVSERSGRRDLFAVSTQGSGSASEPVLVQSSFTGNPFGVSRSGDLFYVGTNDGGYHQVIAERGSAGARVVQAFGGLGGMWSRGNKLAFIRPGETGNDLIVRSLDTGEERLYQHAGIGVVSPRWLRDGSKAIVFINTPTGGFYLLDVNTGSFSRLFAKDAVDHARAAVTALSPDDKTLYTAVRANLKAPWTAIVGLDLATGAERPVVTLPGSGVSSVSPPGLAISPDGNTLAIETRGEGSSTDGSILTVRTDGTELRELVGRIPSGSGPDLMRWTPDGQFIVYAAGGNPLPGGWRIMRISVSGGEPEFDGLDSSKLDSAVPLPLLETGNVASIDLSPDGSRIVFSSRALPTHDIWTIENVMSAVGRRR